MVKKSLCLVFGIMAIMVLAGISAGQAYAEEVSIVGKVTDNYTIVEESGTEYEVADTDMGNELLNHVGKTVEATGNVTAVEGVQVINVTSYTVLE